MRYDVNELQAMSKSNKRISAVIGFYEESKMDIAAADGTTHTIRFCKCRGCGKKLIKRNKDGAPVDVQLRNRGTSDLIPHACSCPGILTADFVYLQQSGTNNKTLNAAVDKKLAQSRVRTSIAQPSPPASIGTCLSQVSATEIDEPEAPAT